MGRVWPSKTQNRLQAMFDADDGIGSADFPEFLPRNADGEPALFCGECGKIGPTNPDNDVCAQCENCLIQPTKDNTNV